MFGARLSILPDPVWRSPEPLRCFSCGHASSHHGATFCTFTVGGAPGSVWVCDCEKWDDPRGHSETYRSVTEVQESV